MVRPLIGSALAFIASSAAFVAAMTAIRPESWSDGAVRALPVVALFAVAVGATWMASKLWEKWRVGLGVCLVLEALMSFQLARQVPPEFETGTVSRNYFILAAAFVLAGAAAIGWHRRLFSRS